MEFNLFERLEYGLEMPTAQTMPRSFGQAEESFGFSIEHQFFEVGMFLQVIGGVHKWVYPTMDDL